jgi:plastocyanin
VGLLAAIAVALVFLLPSSSHAANPQLCATVGTADQFVITFQDATCTGPNLTNVNPGTYDIVVKDNSTLHNFHLIGPGSVDMATAVELVENPTWTVTLVDGTYTYRCDPHFDTMNGSFTVGTSAVTFASATARRTARDVLVRWRTGTEADLLGFNLYRSQGQSWKRITRSLIAAKGSVSGASYRYLDRTAKHGISYRYRIKAVHGDGTATWFGPVRVT